MAEGKSSGIIYLEPSRLLFYSDKVKKVLVQDFPPDIVSDLEIVNKEKFSQVLQFFIQNGLQKEFFDLTLIFSSQMCFEKALVPTISKDIDTLVAEFISIVPFEEVLSKVYKENKNVKIVAVNKEFYEQITDNFARSGSSLNIVLPLPVVLEKSPELASNMELPALASKVDSLKAYNMLEFTPSQRRDSSTPPEAKNKNLRVYVLGGVFLLLLILMLVFAYNTFAKPENNKERPIRPTPTIKPVNTSQPTPDFSPTTTASPTSSQSPNL